MKVVTKAILLCVSLLLLSCGGSDPQFEVRPLPVAGQDPRVVLKNSGGTIYFEFVPLKSSDLSDVDDTKQIIVFPERSSENFDPLANEFNLTAAPIDDYTLYHVIMYGIILTSGSSTPTYKSVASCAYQKALGSKNYITLCFGQESDVDKYSTCPSSRPCPQYLTAPAGGSQ